MSEQENFSRSKGVSFEHYQGIDFNLEIIANFEKLKYLEKVASSTKKAERDRDVTFVFIKFIHQVLKNEKAAIIKKKSFETISHGSLIEINLIDLEDNYDLTKFIIDDNANCLEDFFQNVFLAKAVGTLNGKEKLILFRRFILGEKDPEIGRNLGISSQAVSKQRRNILNKLKNELSN